MTTNTNQRTGGQLLVDALAHHGADLAFCVPGESYLAALDALHDRPDIRLITCRQEGGVTMMADAYAKLTGKPGIAFVTRGPGATNATPGLHIAHQDSSPVILFIGQVARDQTEREAFQELDYRRFLSQVTKWTGELQDAGRATEFVSHAFHTAAGGRPGPVAVSLPEDMLRDHAEGALGTPFHAPDYAPVGEDITRFEAMVAAAERPVIIVGGGRWSEETGRKISKFAEANDIPLMTSFRCQDFVDNRGPAYAGCAGIAPDPDLVERIKTADLVIVVGARMGEMTSGRYSYLAIPRPVQRLVHVHPDPEEIGRVYQADLGLVATPAGFAGTIENIVVRKDRGVAKAAHQRFLEFTTPVPMSGDVQMADIVNWMSENLPEDTIYANGGGNCTVWLHRFMRYKRYRTQLAPTSGSMGYGVPSAVAAKLVHPDRHVISFSGDGCFMMNGQEFATAAQYDLPIVFLVINNAMYGTIRMHQERDYTGREIATLLKNPNFADLARAYGCHGAVVEKTEDFRPALETALKQNGPSIIEVRIDPDVLSPTVTISGLQSKG
ncbi:MAG: thiamine pyrophosphate-binding protein [Rhizobiales bacterium NRL2]|jgi:acetolactate synthase-1/2/3 large subunit|nr:MAG: thiamine pyrophosphate-binding protein [Rhizobiales bacterium NRL2]